MSKSTNRYHQLVLINVRQPEVSARYGGLVRPVVERYGGGLVRRITPASFHGDAMPAPDVVNFVHYDDKPAFEAFSDAPDFRAIVHLRAQASDMAVVEGHAEAGPSTSDLIDGRIYFVELARYGPAGREGYRRYEREMAALGERHGYHVEWVLEPELTSGLPFTPDLAKIAYCESQGHLDRMHGDPAHARIEHELYPAAVAESVWVIGRGAWAHRPAAAGAPRPPAAGVRFPS